MKKALRLAKLCSVLACHGDLPEKEVRPRILADMSDRLKDYFTSGSNVARARQPLPANSVRM